VAQRVRWPNNGDAVTEIKYQFLFNNAPVPLWEEDVSRLVRYFSKLRAKGVADLRHYFEEYPDEIGRCAQMIIHRKVNQAALRLWGAESIDDFLMSKPVWRKPPMANYIKENIISLFNGCSRFSREECSVNLLGKTIYYHGNNVVLTIPNRKRTYLIGSSYDLTDLKLAEQKLQDYNNYLEEIIEKRTARLEKEIQWRKRAEIKAKNHYLSEQKARLELETQIRLRTDFFRALVHELKTPLTAMMGASEALSLKMAEGVDQRLAKNINEGAKQLDKRINELMDIARGEIGVLTINKIPTDIKALLESIVEDFAILARLKRASIKVAIATNIPEIAADPGRLKQIIQNLICNAIEHSPTGVNIYIQARKLVKNIEFVIRDSGPGLTKNAKKHLFQMYYIQRTEANMEKLSGLGIGLALCKILVELHGGKILAESELGKGCVFKFTLPIK